MWTHPWHKPFKLKTHFELFDQIWFNYESAPSKCYANKLFFFAKLKPAML